MTAFTMQPLAGAHGELTGAMLMAAYHKAKGNRRKYIIIPDSSFYMLALKILLYSITYSIFAWKFIMNNYEKKLFKPVINLITINKNKE